MQQSHHHHSLEDLTAQRQTILKALNLPGIPADEREIYQNTIRSIDAKIAAIQAEQSQRSQPIIEPETMLAQNSPNFEHTIKPDKPDLKQIAPSTIIAGGHNRTTGPITNTIELDNNSNKFNPTITITWSDGYKLTVDETSAVSRFKSTFRDTISLKCVSEERYNRMWRWDTPWRSAGFYKAISFLREGIPPTLKDLGYTHPSDRQREVFALITQQAAAAEVATNPPIL